jgi:hypothetical protein
MCSSFLCLAYNGQVQVFGPDAYSDFHLNTKYLAL